MPVIPAHRKKGCMVGLKRGKVKATVLAKCLYTLADYDFFQNMR